MEPSLPEQSKSIANKPIVIFTNFWDADVAVRDGNMIVEKDGEHYKINLLKNSAGKPENFEVVSIALQHPPISSLKNLVKSFSYLHTLDFMCPTYDILMAHKKGGAWEKYEEDFKALMRSRKEAIREWLSELESKVYILCCWENTSGKSKCHRQIIYNAMINSKHVCEKAMLFYRHGGKRDVDGSAPLLGNAVLNTGDDVTEVENANVTRLKKAGIIDAAPRAKNNYVVSGFAGNFITISDNLAAPLPFETSTGIGMSIGFSAPLNQTPPNIMDLFGRIDQDEDIGS